MDEAPGGEDGSLKFLRTLVNTLMIVMIIGFIVLIGLLVTRFPSAPEVIFPEEITLPDGTAPVAFTQGKDWYAVVNEADEILVYDKLTGALVQTIKVILGD